MKCKKVQKNLSGYADGEVRPKLRQRLERHLTVCEKCAVELSRLEAVTQAAEKSLLRVVSTKAPPPELRERVMQATQSLWPRLPVMIPAGKLAAAAVTIALVSGLLVGVAQELRFRSKREDFRREIAEQSRGLTLAKRDSGTAREQLTEAQAKLSEMEAQLALASAVRDDSDRIAEVRPSPDRRLWPPVLCSLQMSDAESLLKNGLF
ncbi:zf-HC2 domain-containing protein [bacterium]|nr:zf-HC2 domain-containing protein [bacterium]